MVEVLRKVVLQRKGRGEGCEVMKASPDWSFPGPASNIDFENPEKSIVAVYRDQVF